MFYALRVTPSEFKCPFGFALGIIKALLKRKDVEEDMYITADEVLDKYGRKTHRHFHFNFICDGKKDTLQRFIRRWFLEREYICNNANCYALSVYDEPDDEIRWWRYCMKEKVIASLTRLDSFTITQIEEFKICARDERKRSIQANLAYEKKQKEKSSMFDRIKKHLSKMDLKTFRSINIEIVKYYVSEGKPICVRTVDGYTNNYMLSSKLITYEEFYNQYHKD